MVSKGGDDVIARPDDRVNRLNLFIDPPVSGLLSLLIEQTATG
jgi:hypothetical protein